MTDELIRKSDALAKCYDSVSYAAIAALPVVSVPSKRIHDLNAEALGEIKAVVDGKSSQPIKDIIYGLLDEIAALEPVAPAETKPNLTNLTGHFATAAIDFIETMQAHGFTAGAGQSTEDELDFCVSIYRGDKVHGCASFHEDRTWSCYMEIGEQTFRCDSTPWFTLPEGLADALAVLTPTAVNASQPADPAVNAPDHAAIREAAAVVEREIAEAKRLMPIVVPILRCVHRDILALIPKGAAE